MNNSLSFYLKCALNARQNTPSGDKDTKKGFAVPIRICCPLKIIEIIVTLQY